MLLVSNAIVYHQPVRQRPDMVVMYPKSPIERAL